MCKGYIACVIHTFLNLTPPCFASFQERITVVFGADSGPNKCMVVARPMFVGSFAKIWEAAYRANRAQNLTAKQVKQTVSLAFVLSCRC